jgi:hypothetical protein
MAYYIMSYMYSTKELALVLGGQKELDVNVYTDASLGTGPKGRSVTANFGRLNQHAGAVSAKTEATKIVFGSSFEAELDGAVKGYKRVSRITNIIDEIRLTLSATPKLWSDNKAMIDFVQSKSVAKGVRHMELRLWYIREKYKENSCVLDYMAGEIIPTDKLTKLGTKDGHFRFTRDIMGHALLQDDIQPK